tara:strand:+ start:745 stop:1458 length:714 start_codon:yes stop_codon:yes gene_type:complete
LVISQNLSSDQNNLTKEKQQAPFYLANHIDPDQQKAGHKLFAKQTEFIKGITSITAMPSEGHPEVCFSGRSNVGKSSLINNLTGRNSIARTSKTPGRTREINFFLLDQNKFLVDLPGYGFAKAPLKERERWQRLVSDYFFQSQNLRRVFLLIDSRHGIKSSDINLMKMLGEAGVIFQVVFTKHDKVKELQFKEVLEASFEKMAAHANAFSEVLLTSSRKGHGIALLRATISKLFHLN